MKESPINMFKVVFPKLSRLLFLFGATTFFLAIADSIMSYLVPVILTNSGLSNTEMGLLTGSAAVFGAIFDFFLAKFLKSTNYKRMYIYTIILAFLFPILMFSSSIFWVYLFAMMVWGLFYNFWSFGYYDFVAREEIMGSHATSFGFLSIFNDIGYVVGPLVASQFILNDGSPLPFLSPIFALLVALLFLIGLLVMGRSHKNETTSLNIKNQDREHNVSFTKEFQIWGKIIKALWPILLLGVFLSLIETLFWTVSPLLNELLPSIGNLGGVFMAASLVPSLFINWSVGAFTSRFGKKNTAFVAFLLSCLILFVVGFVSNPYIVILLVFLSALVESLAFPAVAGSIADYLKESKSFDTEILGVKGFFGNIGCIFGPVIAGLMMDRVGSLMIFSYFAAAGIVVAIFLIFFGSRNIDFHDKSLK